MRVRRMTSSGDMTFGQSSRNFYVDQAEGVGQVVKTRLGLFAGDWFLDLLRGTLWAQRVLGRQRGREVRRDAVIRARIAGTPGFNSFLGYSSSINRDTRAMRVDARIDTTFGPVSVASRVPDPTPYFEQGFAQP